MPVTSSPRSSIRPSSAEKASDDISEQIASTLYSVFFMASLSLTDAKISPACAKALHIAKNKTKTRLISNYQSHFIVHLASAVSSGDLCRPRHHERGDRCEAVVG